MPSTEAMKAVEREELAMEVQCTALRLRELGWLVAGEPLTRVELVDAAIKASVLLAALLAGALGPADAPALPTRPARLAQEKRSA